MPSIQTFNNIDMILPLQEIDEQHHSKTPVYRRPPKDPEARARNLLSKKIDSNPLNLYNSENELSIKRNMISSTPQNKKRTQMFGNSSRLNLDSNREQKDIYIEFKKPVEGP